MTYYGNILTGAEVDGDEVRLFVHSRADRPDIILKPTEDAIKPDADGLIRVTDDDGVLCGRIDTPKLPRPSGRLEDGGWFAQALQPGHLAPGKVGDDWIRVMAGVKERYGNLEAGFYAKMLANHDFDVVALGEEMQMLVARDFVELWDTDPDGSLWIVGRIYF